MRHLVLLLVAAAPLAAQTPLPQSEIRDSVQLWTTDTRALGRRWDADWSPAGLARRRAWDADLLGRLDRVDFDRLGLEGRIDWLLLRNTIRRQEARLDLEAERFAGMDRFVPFASQILDLHEARRRLETPDPKATARTLADLASRVDSLRAQVEKPVKRDTTRETRIVALRSVGALESLRKTLDGWYKFSAGYDPVFTWWNQDPWKRTDSALVKYTRALRKEVVGQKEGEDEPIIGDPIGDAALRKELAFEFIPYGPDELVDIAEREFAWSEAEMKKASKDLGFGDDWKKALEQVKNTYVEPGKQPALVRDLAREAIEFVTSRDLLTVPPLATEVWRMEMLSPERQKVSPFFLGGETILVSYPTDAMSEDDKLMSLRGNNPHFSRATVHHELIPGHHLQAFMTDRYNPHRDAFHTPFWTEGWALYWEMLLWDRGFPRTPEEKIGMLFWRMHRSARIIFSLRFHLGTMTPQQSIDFLVDRVGHERANATAEVRRSFNGTYPPLYQIAYMIGGLQFRALHRELVDSGRMTDRVFHDAILQGGTMPVEMVRARLLGTMLPRDYQANWRF
jgi:uncharacterized protein (DUF885 family)